jgi:threonine dehydrogenase-like Zn-dependent dehydrogenase
MGTGQCPVRRYNRRLRDLIIAGRATPGWITSHELGLDQAVEGYDRFDNARTAGRRSCCTRAGRPERSPAPRMPPAAPG